MQQGNAQKLGERLDKQGRLSRQTQAWFEGFSENLGGNQFTYESIREDVTSSLLTRTTNGKMEIEWITDVIPEDWEGKEAGFLWIAAMDKPNPDEKFFMFVNGDLKFVFTNPSDSWDVSSDDGGKLAFFQFMTDRHGDSHGYMTLQAPSYWLTPGEGLRIKVVGEAAGTNTWCIVYQAPDALSYLHLAAEYEGWFEMTGRSAGEDHSFTLAAPGYMAGQTISVQVGGKVQPVEFVLQDSVSHCTFSLKGARSELKDAPFSLFQNNRKLFEIPGLFIRESLTELMDPTLVIHRVDERTDGTWILKTRIVYKPRLINSLKTLSNTSQGKGNIYLMNSSHQDIAWMDSPENCVVERDTMLLSPLLEQASVNPEYRFDIEDVLMVREFIERHPEKKTELTELFRSGRLTCGSTYIQPYEEMYSGESLIRQFYLGARWLSMEFEGYKPETYWNVDVPGRTLQMPQIAKKAGTRQMVISRHQMGVFRWYSPDGSFVTTYSPGHYASSFPHLHRDFFSAAAHIADQAVWWGEQLSSPGSDPVVPLLSDWDMSPAVDYSPIIDQWHNLRYFEDESGKRHPVKLPRIELASTTSFIRDFERSAGELPSIMGERPAVWLYIHGPSHQKALKASREGDILMTVAEKFSAIEALLAETFESYPQERLTKAWEAKIYPDHGWGGKNGEITDSVFLGKFEKAHCEATEITRTALRSISSRVMTERNKGIPAIAFNSLSWERSDPVHIHLELEAGWGKNVMVQDHKGKRIECQLTEPVRYPDGTLKTATLHFVAENVPPVGYKTYYINPSPEKREEHISKKVTDYENDFYQIELSNGFVEQIVDKQLGQHLLDGSNLKGGEVFTMQSKGNGAGEFADIQQPTLEEFDRVANYNAAWQWIEKGEVFSQFVVRQPIRNTVVEETLVVYNGIKRIDFKISLIDWQGILFREYRMALPLDLSDGKVAYEVPFGVVEVGRSEIEGAAGERYQTPCKEVHPRGIENWIAAYDEKIGITLSSSVAVADFIDPTNRQFIKPVLQPLLLASRRSCHGEGNEYLQAGDHHFSFSLTSHLPGWENGYKFGRQSNEKLLVVFNPQASENKALPEEISFFSVDRENAIISAIKKCEDDNSLIIRVYESEGKDGSCNLTSHFDLEKAFKTNIIEVVDVEIPAGNKHLTLEIGPHAVETFKLVPGFRKE